MQGEATNKQRSICSSASGRTYGAAAGQYCRRISNVKRSVKKLDKQIDTLEKKVDKQMDTLEN